jgi:alkanesulfonate monooxygenase SsuD/methylene tetrahydromethanopterin reductase-like flavin-dependent oxidoreductase (luciferase family)
MPARAPLVARFGGIGLWLQAPETGGCPVAGVLGRAVAAVDVAVGAGIGSVWVSESPPAPHLGGYGALGSHGGVPYEAYSLLGALAVRTERVHLGVVADGAERRAPSILTKIVTGVDVISHGRGVLALDGDCTSDADAERLLEALTVCRSVLVDEHPTYAGRIYSIDNAVNRPAPVQPGGVPIVVFLHGEGPGRAAELEVVARLADAVVVDGGPDGVRDACHAVAARAYDREGGVPVEVLGRTPVGPTGVDLADRVGAMRSAGAAGCLVATPYPWDAGPVADVASNW